MYDGQLVVAFCASATTAKAEAMMAENFILSDLFVLSARFKDYSRILDIRRVVSGAAFVQRTKQR